MKHWRKWIIVLACLGMAACSPGEVEECPERGGGIGGTGGCIATEPVT